MNTQEKYECVVISGGGSNGILSLGALHYEYQKGLLDEVKIYAGTSIGSVISLLLICDYAPMEIFGQVYTLSHFFDINKCGSIWDIINYMGFMPIDVFIGKIEEMVKAKFPKGIPTLKDLFELKGKILVVPITNITKMKCEYYTYKTNPNISCIDAVMQSCNLPVVFHKIKYEDSYIIDGGLIDNFPLAYVDNHKRKILGIVTTGVDKSLPDDKFMGYFYRIIIMPVNANTELRCKLAGENTKLIKIVKHKSSLKLFSIPSNVKMSMFWEGYIEAEKSETLKNIYVEGW